MKSYEDLTKKLKESIRKQNSYTTGTYESTYWQGQKYGANEKLESMLPENKKLALKLYKKLHSSLPSETAVKWIFESKDFLHDWEAELHKAFLKKADKLLAVADYVSVEKSLDIIF